MKLKHIVSLVLLAMSAAACGPQEEQGVPTTLLPGDASRGQTLFVSRIDNLPECSSCHSLDGSRGTGPSLLGYGEAAGTRRSGMSAEAFTASSILRPGDVITSGFSNIMPSNYGQHLSDQDLADLVAYVLNQ